MKPILITSGEPAGIGPDICLSLGSYKKPLVIMGSKELLVARAKLLHLDLEIEDYDPQKTLTFGNSKIYVHSIPNLSMVEPGKLSVNNSSYVLTMLDAAIKECMLGNFSALVTAPVHKGIISQAGYAFSGHTEFLAERSKAKSVVMMLASKKMRVALVTTHLPLQEVPKAITQELIFEIIRTLNFALKQDFGIKNPKILVAGLNPHAGESGYLGREEIETIIPALTVLQAEGIEVAGPYPADTLFTQKNLKKTDAFVAMYHDQGLAVLKYASFSDSVNISLGLPIIRTSVDHGTALDIAGTGQANPSSLHKAIDCAFFLAKNRNKSNANN